MRCAPGEGLAEGEACASPFACAPGLRCETVGFAGACAPEGDGDIGASCEADAACAAPLLCNRRLERCELPVFVQPGFPELDCPEPDEEGPFRVLFEVPDGARGDDDFFRLPFPNDIRLGAAGIDLQGFPQRRSTALAGPVVDAALALLEDGGPDGFSTNPAVVFRMSRAFDTDSFRSADEEGPAIVDLVDITPGSPDYGRSVSRGWRLNTGRTPFVCRGYATVRPSWSRPLRPGTTYALWITRDITDDEGNAAVQDADFARMLEDDRPSSGVLRDAWERYAPLRDFLADAELDGGDLAVATVFTTMSENPVFPAMRDAVSAGAAAEWVEAAVCVEGEESVCGRPCAGPITNVAEIHARIRLPVWQTGESPRLEFGSGGGVAIDGDGRATFHGYEEACAVLTLPSGNPPADGWPLVVYAHGTGGDAASHVRDGTAGRLSSVTISDDALPADSASSGTTEPEPGDVGVGMATLGFDGVLHADRNPTQMDPDILFFNAANPEAGRGNVEQGAGDLFALFALLQEGSLPVEGLGDVPVDTTRLAFFGHSQGMTVGAGFLAWSDAPMAAVLSGAAGGFALSLLTKTEPVDIAGAVAFALQDGSHGDHHPALHLLQTWIDPVDPLNLGRRLLRERPAPLAPLPLFVTVGENDAYTPFETQQAFAGALGAPQIIPSSERLSGLLQVDAPAGDTVRIDETRVTAGVRVYAPEGYDGHFVAFRDAQARMDVARFLATAMLGTPLIGVED